MNVTARAAQVGLQDLDIGGLLTIQEVRLSGTGVTLADGGTLRAAEASGTLVVTEAALNRFLAGQTFGPVRDLEVATLTGRVRVSGKWSPVSHVWIPFKATGVPEIEGGARLRFNWQQISSVGGVPIPGVQMIGEYVNGQLAQMFDATRLPVPVRLTALTVEPGRLLLSAVSSLELRAPETAAQPPSPAEPGVLE